MVVVEPVTQSGDLEGKSCAGEPAIGRPALVPLEVDQTAAEVLERLYETHVEDDSR